jgi:hypothetical protein
MEEAFAKEAIGELPKMQSCRTASSSARLFESGNAPRYASAGEKIEVVGVGRGAVA